MHELKLGSGCAGERDGELFETRLDTSSNVEHFVHCVRAGGQNVRLNHVFDVYKIHSLIALAVDGQWEPSVDSLHPRIEHRRVHAWTVDVVVAKRDVRKASHGIEGAEQSFVEELGRSIE